MTVHRIKKNIKGISFSKLLIDKVKKVFLCFKKIKNTFFILLTKLT